MQDTGGLTVLGADKNTGDIERTDLSRYKVMIVEDDAQTLEVLSESLRFFGAQVHPCGTVGEAPAFFEKFQPDVLVSDISMPIEDGYSLIQKIRELGPEKCGDVLARI